MKTPMTVKHKNAMKYGRIRSKLGIDKQTKPGDLLSQFNSIKLNKHTKK